MNVLSLFDGISCGQVALKRIGKKVNNYYASEIDKYAIKITQKNFPDTIQLGDITKWKEWNIDFSSINLVIGGSPCQGFSLAGKQLNFNDERSKLFFVFVDILNHVKKLNPKVSFLLENVKMKKEYQDVISKCLNVEPIFINSSLVSAQNRKRLYWTNIPNITQPKDKKIFLKDVIENTTDNKSISKDNSVFIRERGHGYLTEKIEFMNKLPALVLSNTEYFPIINYNFSERTQIDESLGQREKRIMIKTIPHGYVREKVAERNKYPSLVSQNSDTKYKIAENNITWRKLTPIECERLQTLPDNYTEGISDSQRYKCLGNGWTVDVIAHIFSFME